MKKEKRSLFNMIFGKKTKQAEGSYLQVLSGYNPVYTKTNNLYDSNIAKECINTIATHAAKMLPRHVQKRDGITKKYNGDINYLLSVQPNAIMTTYDFLYKVTSMLYSENNAFIYIDKDNQGMIKGFFPLNPQNCILYENNGRIYVQFQFGDGNSYFTLYDNVIHLRRFYNNHDFYGENNDVLNKAIQTANVANEGIQNAIKTSTALKGVLKYSNAMMKPKDIKENRDQFVNDFIYNTRDGSGIASIDAKAEFQEINLKPVTLDKNQLDFVNSNIFDYFGISENIIKSNFTDEEWNAFYESVIEPLAIQMSNAFTTKIFSESSIKNGHQIIFDVNRIKYAKTETKISLLKETAILGLYTIDEAREILDLPAIGGEEGKKRLQTLNVVNQNIADEYQIEKKKNKDGGNEDGKEKTGNQNEGNKSTGE